MKGIRLLTTIFLFLWMGLGQIQAQLEVSIEIQAPSCSGYSDGIATATATGGIEPYDYQWSNNETGPIIFGMTVGNFSVTVTDANGETAIANTTINEPDPISASVGLAESANICDGTNLGLEVFASGGTAPYSYQWSTGDVGDAIDDLEPGAYTVTITDDNNCTQTAIYIVNEPFELTVMTLDVICADFCDGSAEARITGGIPPYTFLWSNGGTSEVIDLLEAGEYSVTVTDGNGCTLEAIGEITEPENMTLEVTIEGSCEEDAIITAKANASGGTPPYVFTWSNGHVGEQTSDIDRGTTYFVTVTDANGCNMDEQISVPLEPGLVIFPTVQNAACDSGDGGSASVIADGGTEPYIYSWSNGGTGSTIDNLMAGTYVVTATDVNGCKGIDSVVVNDGTALLLFSNMVNATCAGINDGMANVLAEGGEGEYQYQWNDSQNQTSVLATNLAPGEYTVTVTDEAGCMGITSVIVGIDVVVDINLTPTNPTCETSLDGSITAVASGGLGDYTYIWSPAGSSASISSLPPGTYTVTATDVNGCQAVASIDLNAETSLMPDIAQELISCDEDNNIVVTLTGTALADISSWDWVINGDVFSGQVVTISVPDGGNIDASLSVTTAEGCTDETNDSMPIDLFNTNISDVTACTGESLQFNANPDLSYEWSPADIFISGQDSPTPVVNTETSIETTATVLITHPLGCTMTQMVDINITEEIIPDPSAISTQQCEGTSIEFSHTVGEGMYMWEFGDPTNPDANSMNQEVTYMYTEPGIYDVALAPIEGQTCAAAVEFQVEVMEAPTAAFVADFENCTDGTVTFTNMSNVPEDATFEWVFSNGEVSEEENPMLELEASETITATLTINFGEDCELVMEEEVTISVPPTIDLPETLMICAGDSTQLNEGGGDDDYIYTWSPDLDGENPTVTPDETTTYSVTVTDATGECEVTDEVAVEVPPAIESDALEDQDQCDNSLVSITANSAQAVTYKWFTDPELTMLFGEGTILEYNPENRDEVFYILYTDASGCTSLDSVSISNNMPLVNLMPDETLCADEDIQLTSENLIPTDELSYVWTPADMLDDDTSAEPVAMPSESTTYVATITNQFGCSLTDSVTVEVVDLVVELEAGAQPDRILNGESTNLFATENDKYDYTWTANNPDELSSTDIFNPEATPEVNMEGTDPVVVTYNVMIRDENGCVADRDVEVTVLQSNCVEPFIFLPNAFTPNDDGVNDILYVRGYSITDVFLIIYNRWGEQVFQTDKIDRGWDGRHKNELVCPDVYGYYLEVSCFGGEKFIKKGNVTVLK